jgi:serine/threonine protein kinase
MPSTCNKRWRIGVARRVWTPRLTSFWSSSARETMDEYTKGAVAKMQPSSRRMLTMRSKSRQNQQICAVKIIEVDRQDYKADVNFRDDTIKEFIRETTILRSLKANNAKNVNVIYDAFSVDTQLWIVSEYCPGGSLSTLIKASPKKNNGVGCLEESFIIPIAREVAVALKYVHEAGVIHRDIKCKVQSTCIFLYHTYHSL